MNKPIFLLCASAFTSLDYSKFGLFKEKAFKWGYFPETKIYENVSELIYSKDCGKILWCGRFINWKHPDDAINAAFSILTQIGAGPTNGFQITDDTAKWSDFIDDITVINLVKKYIFPLFLLLKSSQFSYTSKSTLS